MSFDPMAAAIDWLDAFRSGDLDFMETMFADEAVIECACCASSLTGKEGLRAFWQSRLGDCAPSELDDLQPSGEGVMLTYAMRNGSVAATLDFDSNGRITFLHCDLITAATSDPSGARLAGTANAG
jgi:ketosteroid isomerase-like protein